MISLHPEAIVKAQSLINIGTVLCIFPINLFGRVAQVTDNLLKNELFASDLNDLISLSNALLNHDQISDLLKLDINKLSIYLDLKIRQFADIKKACGGHTRWLGI